VEILEKESRAIKEAMLSDTNKAKGFDGGINYEVSGGESAKVASLNTPLNVEAKEEVVAKQNDAFVEKGEFFVQVGAFSDYGKAKEVADNMKRFGNVSIFEAYLSKDGVYRVRLGAYQSRGEAMQILDRVLDFGHADVSIVKG
jgi:cell division protein FtsN